MTINTDYIPFGGSGVGGGGGGLGAWHPPPPETYLLFSDVFAVSTPFVLDLDNG